MTPFSAKRSYPRLGRKKISVFWAVIILICGVFANSNLWANTGVMLDTHTSRDFMRTSTNTAKICVPNFQFRNAEPFKDSSSAFRLWRSGQYEMRVVNLSIFFCVPFVSDERDKIGVFGDSLFRCLSSTNTPMKGRFSVVGYLAPDVVSGSLPVIFDADCKSNPIGIFIVESPIFKFDSYGNSRDRFTHHDKQSKVGLKLD